MTEKRKHTIKSFVKRQGRITSGQHSALSESMPKYGLDVSSGAFDLQKCFDRSAPIALEIGCGNGDAMIEMAKKHPEMNFIAVEVYTAGVGRLLANIEINQLQNVRVAQHDAVELLRENIPADSLEKVMIFFPDPWHKRRHHKRRLIQHDFIVLLLEKIATGGQLHLATDWEDYAHQMLKVCSEFSQMHNLSPNGDYIERPDWRPLTKFEQRGQRLGHGVWDLLFEKQP